MKLTEKETYRYQRHIQLNEVGVEGQERLKEAKVLVVGCGGLGCPVLQYLASSGIGTIGIIDFDRVDITNLQRQILFDTFSLGVNKAIAAKRKLHLLNPLITIQTYPEKLGSNNAIPLFEKYDVIVDGSDNFSTRYLINDACIKTGKPFVYGGIYRYEGQVSVFNYQGGPSYRCVFPEHQETNDSLNCAQSGVLGALPGIIGSHQAYEVLKIILNIGKPLSGKLLMINALTCYSAIMKIQRSEEQIEKAFKARLSDPILDCMSEEIPVKEIEACKVKGMLLNEWDIQFIDVREMSELPVIPELQGFHVPLHDIATIANRIDESKPVIIYCQSGHRSKIAVQRLQKDFGFQNLQSLKGGVTKWLACTDNKMFSNSLVPCEVH